MPSLDETDDVVLNVGEFYELVTAHLEAAFGRRHPRWVRGEISKVYEKGHLYLDVVDAGGGNDQRRPVLNAHCWQSAWSGLKGRLRGEGVTLSAGAVVSFFGYVDLYAPSGRVGFTIIDIDVEDLLGDLAKRRQALLAKLESEGLLRRNAERPLSPVPLRVGLVASPQTEGYNDFLGQLTRSGLSFEVLVAKSLVQGEGAPDQLVRAIEGLDERGLDLICVVRGGGSKADLACFDDERVARAIAVARTPVFTGIGHTGDESVADLVAHTRAITPTQLGETVVGLVTQWRERHVVTAAARLERAQADVLDEAVSYVGERRRTVVFAVRDRLRAETRHLGTTRARLVRERDQSLARAREWIETRHRLLDAYDPGRRLAQGWSIVTDSSGRTVRSISQIAANELVRVRVADGSFRAAVQEEEVSP